MEWFHRGQNIYATSSFTGHYLKKEGSVLSYLVSSSHLRQGLAVPCHCICGALRQAERLLGVIWRYIERNVHSGPTSPGKNQKRKQNETKRKRSILKIKHFPHGHRSLGELVCRAGGVSLELQVMWPPGHGPT